MLNVFTRIYLVLGNCYKMKYDLCKYIYKKIYIITQYLVYRHFFNNREIFQFYDLVWILISYSCVHNYLNLMYRIILSHCVTEDLKNGRTNKTGHTHNHISSSPFSYLLMKAHRGSGWDEPLFPVLQHSSLLKIDLYFHSSLEHFWGDLPCILLVALSELDWGYQIQAAGYGGWPQHRTMVGSRK